MRFVVMLAAVFVLMPADSEQQARLWKHSQGLAKWTLSTCERNRKTCEFANDLWDAAREKAKSGVTSVSEKMRARLPDGLMSLIAAERAPAESTLPALARTTLSRADFVPDWRGPLPTLN